MPRHRKPDQVEWKKENKFSTPSADSVFDSTKCYAHREAFDTLRSVTEQFESKAAKKIARTSLKNPLFKKEYARVKQEIEQDIHPINRGYHSAFVSSDKVLIKCSKGRYLIRLYAPTKSKFFTQRRTCNPKIICLSLIHHSPYLKKKGLLKLKSKNQ